MIRRQQALSRLQASTRRVMGSSWVQEMRANQVTTPDLAEVRRRLAGLARPLSAEVLDERQGR